MASSSGLWFQRSLAAGLAPFISNRSTMSALHPHGGVGSTRVNCGHAGRPSQAHTHWAGERSQRGRRVVPGCVASRVSLLTADCRLPSHASRPAPHTTRRHASRAQLDRSARKPLAAASTNAAVSSLQSVDGMSCTQQLAARSTALAQHSPRLCGGEVEGRPLVVVVAGDGVPAIRQQLHRPHLHTGDTTPGIAVEARQHGRVRPLCCLRALVFTVHQGRGWRLGHQTE